MSKNGGRTSYRGVIKIGKNAENAKSSVVCDALLLDKDSQSDTYPYIEVDADQVNVVPVFVNRLQQLVRGLKLTHGFWSVAARAENAVDVHSVEAFHDLADMLPVAYALRCDVRDNAKSLRDQLFAQI